MASILLSPRVRPFALLIVAVLSVTAHAADHPLGGDLLHLKDPAAPAGRRLRFVARHDAAIVSTPANDPRSLGASLVIWGAGR